MFAGNFSKTQPIRFVRIIITIGTSLIWLINGLFCKILSLVPRHELIVARILGSDYAGVLTKLIGAGELLIFIWILSGFKGRECAVFQIVVITTMNILEFVIAPDLLLYGKVNIIFASALVAVIYSNEFILKSRESQYSVSK